MLGAMSASVSETITLPGGAARVEWRRSLRARRVSLRIDPREGHIVVTLPPRTARHAGMALLMDHAAWVVARLAALPRAVPFADGAVVPFHGTPHRIRHDPALRAVRAEGGEIVVGGAAEFLPRRVADFYRAEARRALSALALRKAETAALRPRRVSVKDTSSRWGSCAADRSLAFSWRLVMAPPFVQDYVAAHEVAHLRHMNHGPRFWALVAQLTPHGAAAMAWLKREGPGLLRIG
jgi:predicted metal-dependent hydrolase